MSNWEQQRNIEAKVRQLNVPGGTFELEYKLSRTLGSDEKIETILETHSKQYCVLVATHRRLIIIAREYGAFMSGDLPYDSIELIEYESKWLEKHGKIKINQDRVFVVDKTKGEDFVNLVKGFISNIRLTFKAHGFITQKELLEQKNEDRKALISRKQQQLDNIRQAIRKRQEESGGAFLSPHWWTLSLMTFAAVKRYWSAKLTI